MILSQNNHTLTIQRVKKEDSGQYTCRACNSRGCDTAQAFLTTEGQSLTCYRRSISYLLIDGLSYNGAQASERPLPRQTLASRLTVVDILYLFVVICVFFGLLLVLLCEFGVVSLFACFVCHCGRLEYLSLV